MAPSPLPEQEHLVIASASYGSLHPKVLFKDEASIQLVDPNPSPSKSLTSQSRSILVRTQSSFIDDARKFNPGTLPHSIVHALCIGVICGVCAFVYYAINGWLLALLWHELPERIVVNVWPEWSYVLWIPCICLPMAVLLGLSVVYLGDPGDLPYTIKCVHEKGYIAMNHVLPMVVASQFSILGGASLGPEAPLIAICAALGGLVSKSVFKNRNRNIVRKHTLMGMAGALAAFFGCPLGGSLFALEVNSRFGVEYFEHAVEAILCGEVTLAVFRGLARMPIDSIWIITANKLMHAQETDILLGGMLGLVGAIVAYLFAAMHYQVMEFFKYMDLLRDERAVYRGLVGGSAIVLIGVCIPHTLFWGEVEFQTIASLSPASTLPHVWPTSGLFHFEMDSGFKCLLVGVAKLVAVTFSVCGGYRGGFIFPLFSAGAAFGRAISFVLPGIPVQLTTLCMAASLNVAITRTTLATTLILVSLSDEPRACSATLGASLVALFATGYMPFIKSQIARSDLDLSLYFDEEGEVTVVQQAVGEEVHV